MTREDLKRRSKTLDEKDLSQYRDAIANANVRNDIEEIKHIIIDINKTESQQDLEIWRQYYLAQAHSLIADSFFKGKTYEMAYNHAKSAVDTLSGLSRQSSADVEVYALLGGALGRLAAGVSDPVSKATLGMKSDRALQLALEDGPENPRALFMHGRSLLLKPRLFGGNKKQGIKVLSDARERFLDQSTPEDPLPKWGLEETCFWLAYGLLHFNRFDEARSALAPLLDQEPKYYLVEPMLSRIDEKEHKARHG